MKKLRYKLGDIVKIPLSAGRFCYGRMFLDSTVAIYFEVQNQDWKKMLSFPPDLVAGVFTSDFCADGWEIVGHIPFQSEDEAWPPPMWNRDIVSSKMQIYHRGELHPSSDEAVVGLHKQLMYKPHQLSAEIEAILKTSKSKQKRP